MWIGNILVYPWLIVRSRIFVGLRTLCHEIS
jgi:hypothetical protein